MELNMMERLNKQLNGFKWYDILPVTIMIFSLLAMLFTQSLLANPFQLLVSDNKEDPYTQKQIKQSPEYRLFTGDNKRVLYFEGFIDFGATEDLRNYLDKHPEIQAIVLNSQGGPVYEARGMAKVITQHNLSAYTTSGCSSACVTAFIGGVKRWVGHDASIGFHQYRLEAIYVLPFINVAKEFEKDFNYYRARGVDLAYIQKAYDTQHNSIWYPDYEALLAAHVIDGIADPADFMLEIVSTKVTRQR